jgi:hypothetical protein
MSPFIERRLAEGLILAVVLVGYGVYVLVRWVAG